MRSAIFKITNLNKGKQERKKHHVNKAEKKEMPLLQVILKQAQDGQ